MKSHRAAAASCNGYNDGKYGLGNLAGTYMARAGAATILKTYLSRYLPSIRFEQNLQAEQLSLFLERFSTFSGLKGG